MQQLKTPIFLPKDMNHTHSLETCCNCFGPAPAEDFYTNKERREHISSFYNLLHLFWLGYFTFLDCINKLDLNILLYFINISNLLINIPITAINNKNKNFIIINFITIYALHILTIESKDISTICRIQAIKILKTMNVPKPFNFWYSRDSIKNLIPSSFDSSYYPDKLYNKIEFYQNQKVLSIFGKLDQNINRFIIGLTTMLTDYKYELIQVLNSFLTLSILPNIVIDFLYRIIDLDQGCLTLIFGDRASYRNRGLVYQIQDEVNYLGSDILKIMVINLRGRNKDLQANTFLKLLTSDQADYKKYFLTLGFSIIQPYNQIKMFMEAHYKSLSLLYHPDKAGDIDKQKLLNEAIEVFRDEQKFNNYVSECNKIAYQLV